MATSDQVNKVGEALLVIGGARSGKSAFAEQLCEKSDFDLLYVATSPRFDGDAEMQSRIAGHVARRGARWHLIEEELALPAILREHMKPNTAILVDCLTLWLNNLMFHERDISAAVAELASVLEQCKGRVVFVTNELGLSVVPGDKLSRVFRDEQGRINQKMASVCDRVVWVAAGLPTVLKPNDQPPIRL